MPDLHYRRYEKLRQLSGDTYEYRRMAYDAMARLRNSRKSLTFPDRKITVSAVDIHEVGREVWTSVTLKYRIGNQVVESTGYAKKNIIDPHNPMTGIAIATARALRRIRDTINYVNS